MTIQRKVEQALQADAEAEVYRVCAGTLRKWDVYQEPAAHPIASFDDKASALNYAMCLARGRVAWHLLLRLAPQRTGNAREQTPRRH